MWLSDNEFNRRRVVIECSLIFFVFGLYPKEMLTYHEMHRPIMAFKPATTASRNQDVGSKTLKSTTSLIIPNAGLGWIEI
jgi:hypothetical protein